ncbi:Conjugative transposon protein TcpC [Actinobacteria bacterium OV450]|nr:Conjugative transposon protein TcpC [Actinobacteria bacterium OV450]
MTSTPLPGRLRASRPQAAPPVSPSLRTTRPQTVPVRRAVSRGPRFARYGIWTALAAGPLALAVTLAAPRTTIAQAAPTMRAADAVRTPTDPGGLAEMFVDLWLRADATAPEGHGVSAAVRALAPEVDLPKRPRNDGPVPAAAKAVAVRTAYGPDGGWTVVVAAISDRAGPAEPLVRYFAVAGTGGKDGGPVRITSAPGEVAAPPSAPRQESAFTNPVASTSPLAASLGEFIRAYLGGGQVSGVERYLAPGAHIAVPSAAAYKQLEVDDVTADGKGAAVEGEPVDGAQVRVRLRVTGEDAVGVRWPLVYRLEVTARAGRWEVSSLEAGTEIQPAALPSAAAAVSGGAR